MGHWYFKALGQGSQVYQSLRDLREIRFNNDPEVIEDRLYIVAADAVTSETFVFLPPGNAAMAVACRASPCPPLDFQTG